MQESVVEVILPGFRFHPTDEELVGFYLHRKIQGKALPFQVIPQCDIYQHDPWDLSSATTPAADDNALFFFCPRDQRFRQTLRPNRVTKSGFWKSTGPDRPIFNSSRSSCLGLKKSLVFYRGKAPKAVKTEWVMHEFRLPSIGSSLPGGKNRGQESWSLCKILQKRCVRRAKVSEVNQANESGEPLLPAGDVVDERQQQEVESLSEGYAVEAQLFNFFDVS